LLEDLDVGAVASQGDREREAADAGARDEDRPGDDCRLDRRGDAVGQSTSVSR
jgi:hypothetical protein